MDWLRDDSGVAAVLILKHLRGEDSLRRLVESLVADAARTWLGTAKTELYRGLATANSTQRKASETGTKGF